MPIHLSIAVGFITLGFLFSLFNWIALVATWRTGRNVSPIGLVGGVLIIVGMLIFPALRPFAWAGALIDPSVLFFLLQSPRMWRQAWQMSRANLLEEYAGDAPHKAVCIRLFRHGWFVMRQRFSNGASSGFVSRWSWDGERLRVPVNDAVAEFASDPEGETLRAVVDFPAVAAYLNVDYLLAGITLKRTFRREPGVLSREKKEGT